MVLNFVEHIFPGGQKIFSGGFVPMLPPSYGPGDNF